MLAPKMQVVKCQRLLAGCQVGMILGFPWSDAKIGSLRRNIYMIGMLYLG